MRSFIRDRDGPGHLTIHVRFDPKATVKHPKRNLPLRANSDLTHRNKLAPVSGSLYEIFG